MEELILNQPLPDGVGEVKVLKKPKARKKWNEKERLCKGAGCSKITTTKWSLCDECREKKQAYLPSPEEIAEACAIIREENNRQAALAGPHHEIRQPKIYRINTRGLRCQK